MSMSTDGRASWPMMAGLATTTGAAVVLLLLSWTGLPDALVVPVLALLMAVMVAGVVADVLVRRDLRRAVAEQRRWLAGLGKDLPTYRHRVDERERRLFAWESSWHRPLGTVFLVGLAAALVPFNLILPLAPNDGVEAMVTVWVVASLLLTGALVVRTVTAARKDSRGLVLPGPVRPAPAPPQPRDPAEVAREESVAKYLVVEDDAAPEVRVSREIERMTSILDSPDAPRPVLPVPADWVPKPASPHAEPATEPAAEPAVEDVVAEEDEGEDDDSEPRGDAPAEPEGELDKLARLFHSAA
ncbi:hypothetical protein [Mumia quercus]|uniref:hypothetical protein n=1 Tax=Mumia quercus TaxID=2976125 RepID=UPI0021CF6E83|nr:hypothetical protein [Mumia quercus]